MTMTSTVPTTSFTTRQVPWMTLGAITDTAVKTSTEAAKLGGLNFTVEKHALFYDVGDGSQRKIDNRRAVVRVDTGECLGVMSTDYPLLQYSEAFDFMDTVSTTYVAAGTLKGGRQGFMVVPANETLQVNDDPHELYVILRTSHDGSRAVEVTVMPLRHRCMNQLLLPSFTKDAPFRWSVPHTSSMHVKLSDAQKSLQKVSLYARAFENVTTRLRDTKVSASDARSILLDVLPDRPRRENTVDTIVNLIDSSDAVGFKGTGWGLLNAVSEYMDWQRPGGNPESRFLNALQGTTQRMLHRTAGHVLTRF